MAFHVTDNWYAERTEEGGVKISKFAEGVDPSVAGHERPIGVLLMDADSWASVCTAVSKSGFDPNQPRKHDQFRDLHDS